jgi:hypothetical protein
MAGTSQNSTVRTVINTPSTLLMFSHTFNSINNVRTILIINENADCIKSINPI